MSLITPLAERLVGPGVVRADDIARVVDRAGRVRVRRQRPEIDRRAAGETEGVLRRSAGAHAAAGDLVGVVDRDRVVQGPAAPRGKLLVEVTDRAAGGPGDRAGPGHVGADDLPGVVDPTGFGGFPGSPLSAREIGARKFHHRCHRPNRGAGVLILRPEGTTRGRCRMRDAHTKDTVFCSLGVTDR